MCAKKMMDGQLNLPGPKRGQQKIRWKTTEA